MEKKMALVIISLLTLLFSVLGSIEKLSIPEPLIFTLYGISIVCIAEVLRKNVLRKE